MPSLELVFAVTLAIAAAYLIADLVARVAQSILRAVIADSNLEAMFVDRPRRIIRLTIFVVAGMALLLPALPEYWKNYRAFCAGVRPNRPRLNPVGKGTVVARTKLVPTRRQS